MLTRNLLIFITLLTGVQCGPQSSSEVLDKGGLLDIQGHRGMRGLFPENSILGFLSVGIRGEYLRIGHCDVRGYPIGGES